MSNVLPLDQFLEWMDKAFTWHYRTTFGLSCSIIPFSEYFDKNLYVSDLILFSDTLVSKLLVKWPQSTLRRCVLANTQSNLNTKLRQLDSLKSEQCVCVHSSTTSSHQKVLLGHTALAGHQTQLFQLRTASEPASRSWQGTLSREQQLED